MSLDGFIPKSPEFPCDRQLRQTAPLLAPGSAAWVGLLRAEERSVLGCPGGRRLFLPHFLSDVSPQHTSWAHRESRGSLSLHLLCRAEGSVTYLTPRLCPRCRCCQQLAWRLSPYQRQQTENEYPGMRLLVKGECNCDCKCWRPGGTLILAASQRCSDCRQC